MAIILPCQGRDTGSTPVTRSIKFCYNISMKQDDKKSEAFKIQVLFGPDTKEARRAQIQELYPELSDSRLTALINRLASAEGEAWNMIDAGFIEKGDEAAYAHVKKKFSWMNKSAQDLVVFRMHYFYWHG